MALFVISVSVALLVSFVCSLMEATLLSLTPSQVAELSVRHPRVGAIWRGFKGNIERPIAVILILNTTAHTIGASVAGAQFDELYGDEWIWMFSLLLTFAMLQYTEILPKTLGVHFNQRIALLIARPLATMIWLLSPIIRVLHLLNRPFEGRRKPGNTPATLEEITSLAMLARISKHITPHQEQIINRAAKLSGTSAEQVMIPIAQVAMFSTSQSLHQALLAAHADAHTRFPVCEGDDRDRIIGYVNFKEVISFMSTNPSDPSLTGIIRPVLMVSPDSPASELLKTFIDQHEHMAIVRDSGGKCLGLITLEDLVEELVGEVQDEFDRSPRHAHQLSGGTWMFGGGVPVNEAFAKLGITPVAEAGNLAAWMGRQLGEPVKAGQMVRHGGVDLLVRRVRRGKAFEVSAVCSKPA